VPTSPAGLPVQDDQGIWFFHYHVNDHIKAGMLTRYEVTR